ncbi:C4-dicarboxylate ABC transporter substrate-binding protein [Pararhodobacter aggregans]|nr:C4-dicarboxylate ABC transporter substrate-binding protein [Pararhodobacter aggregans]PTX01488.1 TRAP-type mannitol/chloroaromatic compound transport system substrate-binding protein [Pararhodobacter aggregans]
MEKPSRRAFIQTAALGSAAAAFAGTTAQAQGRSRIRAAHIVPESSKMYQLSVGPFQRVLDIVTDGSFSFQVFAGGTIAPPLQTYQAVQDGLAEAGMVPPLWAVNLDPVNSLFGGHPGGMAAEELLNWYFVGGGSELLAEHRRETMGLHSMLLSINPSEVWHSHKIIRVPEDLQGVRFRTAGAWATILNEYFGGAATTVGPSEVFTMLERRGVDAAEWSTPSENLIMGLEDAAPYMIVPGIHAPAACLELAIRAEVWDELDASIQRKIEIAAREAVVECLTEWSAADLTAMETMRERGIEIIEMDQSLIDAIRAAGRDWAEAQATERAAAGDDWMRRVTESYYGFHDRWQANSI